jgi:hypothetical protein
LQYVHEEIYPHTLEFIICLRLIQKQISRFQIGMLGAETGADSFCLSPSGELPQTNYGQETITRLTIQSSFFITIPPQFQNLKF